MSLPPLATVEELAAYLQQSLASNDASALLMLSIASDMVRDELNQDITQTTNDVVLFDPIGSAPMVLLAEMPVTAVTLVETLDSTTLLWTTADPTTYTVSKRTGIITGKPWTGVQWPSDPESWRVTYTHGYLTPPDGLVGVVCGVAARTYSSPAAVEMEKIGGYQVKYAMQADGFSPLEKVVLDRYRIARIA